MDLVNFSFKSTTDDVFDTTAAGNEYLFGVPVVAATELTCWFPMVESKKSIRGKVAVLKGDWKGIRLNTQKKPDGPLEIYHLGKDIGEETNLASRQKELTEEFEAVMKREHVELKQN